MTNSNSTTPIKIIKEIPEEQIKAAQYLINHIDDPEGWKRLQEVTGDTGIFESTIDHCGDNAYSGRLPQITCSACPLRVESSTYLCRYSHPNYPHVNMEDSAIILKLIEFIAYVQTVFPKA